MGLMAGRRIVEMAATHDLGLFGNVFIRRVPLEGHQLIPGHKHNYPHASLVVRGRVRVRMRWDNGDSAEAVYEAPAVFEVPAEAYHEMRAETAEAEVWCTFAVRDPDGAIADLVAEQHRTDRSYAL